MESASARNHLSKSISWAQYNACAVLNLTQQPITVMASFVRGAHRTVYVAILDAPSV